MKTNKNTFLTVFGVVAVAVIALTAFSISGNNASEKIALNEDQLDGIEYLANYSGDLKCGEGKCGEGTEKTKDAKAEKSDEKKCGDGDKKEAKADDKKCGDGDKKETKAEDKKCGEGKCGK